jgi:hypothetical protein
MTKTHLAALTALLFLATNAASQTVSEQAAKKEPPALNVVQTLNLWGTTLTFPAASWEPRSMEAAELKHSKVNRQQNKEAFLYEMVPLEEGFENWKTIYGIVAHNDRRWTPELLEQDVLNSYSNACSRVATQKLMSGVITLVYCMGMKENQEVAQLGIFRFLQSGTVSLRVYQEWRGLPQSAGKEWLLLVRKTEMEAATKSLAEVTTLKGSS